MAAAARARVNVAVGTVAGEISPETARIAGGRTEARVALAGCGDWRAVLEEVIALNDLDNPHRAIYALGRFDEDANGQLALPYTNQRPIAA